MRRSGPLVAAAGFLAMALSASACQPGDQLPPLSSLTPDTTQPWPDTDLDLVINVRKPGGAGEASFVIDPPTANVIVATLGSGEIRYVPGPGGGSAVKFPSIDEAADGNLAALHTVIDRYSTVFSPDAQDFQFGLDVYLSEEPRRTTGDDGDNLIQRGLFGQAGQLKLQVDNGIPSCRIAGDQGEALVEGARLEVRQWYRIRCQRAGDLVTMYVGDISESGEVARWKITSTTAPTGLIEFAGVSTAPVSIGGKLNLQGEIVTESPDQFNGALAHIVYDLH